MTDDRSSYVGGPGAATILGVNAYQTPLALWLQLTNRSEPTEVNDAMRSGMRLENAVLAYAAEALETEVLPGPFLRDPLLPLGGHLDGLTNGGDVVEAKTARVRSQWGEPGTDEIPPQYIAQAMHYLGLMPAAKVCWVPVLFSGLEFEMYRVQRDDALIASMRDICAAWWNDYVIKDVPPPPTTGADAALLFPKDTGRIVVADDPTAEAVAELRALRQRVKEYEAREDELLSRVKLAMGDAATLMVDGTTAATWRTTKPTMRFDVSAFKAADPEFYIKFCREQTSRRFLLKDTK